MPLSRLFYGFLCFALLGACAREPKEQKLTPGEPVRVQIPFAVDGKYSLQIVELFTLSNFPALQGLAARFLIDPEASRGVLKGRAPHLRYIQDTNGVFVASDDFSLQLLTVYAHFEKLRILDQQTGLSNVLKYPRTVAVNARLRNTDGQMADNALYSSKLDATLIVPYTKSLLPLMANGGVLAHEHFHALFDKLVVQKLGDKFPDPKKTTVHDDRKLAEVMGIVPVRNKVQGRNQRFTAQDIHDPKVRATYHAAFFRGINEGFADVWGWVYSGDDAFVGRSLPSEKINRDLNEIPEMVHPKEFLLSAVLNNLSEAELTGYAYEHGTQLARAVRNVGYLIAKRKNVDVSSVRPLVGETVIKALNVIQADYATLGEKDFYTLGRVVSIFAKQMPEIAEKECTYLHKLIPVTEQSVSGLKKHCKLGDEAENTENEENPFEVANP